MKQKIILGLMGEIGSGKGTLVEVLKQLTQKSIAQVKSSQVLAETLDLWGLPKTRTNLQDMAIIMENHFGTGTLAQAVKLRIQALDAEIIIYDGMRWQSDVDMIRTFPNNHLIYVTADPKVRFERIKSRAEKVGEENLTFEQFLEDAQKQTETSLAKISSQADFKIQNNSSLEQFKAAVEKIASKIKI